MSPDPESPPSSSSPPPSESTPLLPSPRRRHQLQDHDDEQDIESVLASSSHLSKEERYLAPIAGGERLPYNDYTTIDWLHELARDSARLRGLRASHARGGIRAALASWWERAQGWVAAALIGFLTACVASVVDVAVSLAADWKEGYCSRNVFLDKGACCRRDLQPADGMMRIFGGGGGGGGGGGEDDGRCEQAWINWGRGNWGRSYVVYIAFALLFGLVAGNVTMLTRASLPAVGGEEDEATLGSSTTRAAGKEPKGVGSSGGGKAMYMAAGSGIPEIKTILSGFVIPHFLDLKVLVVKAIGATFAVATGMCLGKEGPFVHISACVGHLVAQWFPKYSQNDKKLREMLSVACSAGLSVAFGAPIGGVLFSYEEISTYFPRRVLWKSFLCSMVAAVTLKQFNPTGTGKLVLFETNYGTSYEPVHYLVFVLLGIAGGIFGGVFCQANFLWSKHFRKFAVIKNHPVLELALVVLATAVLQFPNHLIRDTGDLVMSKLLVDCNSVEEDSWICVQEGSEHKAMYQVWLFSGTIVKLILTIVTFGCKVPSGIIIPALDAGALFGRLVGQLPLLFHSISPGIFAMVGSAAFLAGVSRMTVSLTVIMFELTGEVDYILPFMIAILTAKWVADAISLESVYDLAQHVLGHPFLDPEHALQVVREVGGTVQDLIPPSRTMQEITLQVDPEYKVSRAVLEEKLKQLKARGLMDAGLVLVNDTRTCHGYLPEAELEFGLSLLPEDQTRTDILDGPISDLINRTPLTICKNSPAEMAVEMFGKLGLRFLIVVEEDTAQVVGVIIKKRLVSYVDSLK